MAAVLAGKRVFVAGHRGMVGSALLRRLAREPVALVTATREELDLTCPDKVETWMAAHRPEVVIVAAARVGGILANAALPVSFLEENLLIELSLIRSAFRVGAERLLFLGSSCIYPRDCQQPICEEYLLTGLLEPTNQWYALAKIAGVKLCEAYRRQYGADFVAAMPTNLYGPGDNFDLESSHVVPALIRKMHEAKQADAPWVEVWGTGTPRRELLHVDDLAEACLVLLARPLSGGNIGAAAHEALVNIGSGDEVSIAELADLVRTVVGYRGELRFNPDKPDGTPRKRLDTAILDRLAWRRKIPLRQGLEQTYRWFLDCYGATASLVEQGRPCAV